MSENNKQNIEHTDESPGDAPAEDAEELQNGAESVAAVISEDAEPPSGAESVAAVVSEDVEPPSKQIDIEADSPGQKRKLIISLTWPALAENILTAFMSMADMIMVSGLGAYAISAVGLCTQPKFIMMAAFMAMNVGTTALVARCKGARRPDEANTALNQALMLNIVLTIIIIIDRMRLNT